MSLEPINRSGLSSSKNLGEFCSKLWDYYLSRRRGDEFEPSWVLSSYALVKKALDEADLDEKEAATLREVIKSHLEEDGAEVPVKTGFPNEGSRIIHDCWKAGSFSWIFMGRRSPDTIARHRNFVVLSRKLPDELYNLLDGSAPQVLFAAYDTVEESKNIGPAICLDDLLKEIEDKYGE